MMIHVSDFRNIQKDVGIRFRNISEMSVPELVIGPFGVNAEFGMEIIMENIIEL